jgi:pepF/M3 family oligoendopeptidase
MHTTAAAPTWDLDSLLPRPDGADFRERLDAFRTRLEELASDAPKLPPAAADAKIAGEWAAFLTRYEAIESQALDFASHIGCHAAADAGNAAFRQIEAELSSLDPLRERVAIAVEFALKACDDSVFDRFVAADRVLETNRFWLQQRRKNAALRLSEPEETLAAELGVDGIHAWGRLYDRVSGELRVAVMERGRIVEKSPGQIRLDSPDRSLRQNNFYASERAWHTLADTCADALNHIAGSRLTMYRRLKLQDHLVAPLARNRMTRATLDAMWAAVSQRKHTLLRYLEAKAKRLGVDRMAWYDLNAPLPGLKLSSPTTSFESAKRSIIDTFSRFTPDFGSFAQHAFDSRWIEGENRSGKRQGAFCTTYPTFGQSRVFMTYTDTADDMSTLAHELGHAFHSWVLRHQPPFLQDYPMNLAETASTFAETVLAEQQLREAASTDTRLSILDNMLSDAVAYLMNIHARFLFENQFHEERAAGEIPASRLSDLMLAAQRSAYLDSLDPDGWYPEFWVSKLHFYISGLPFYNFPYTFGYLLSTGLYSLAADSASDFPERYRRLLVATGCEETEAAVHGAFGYDLQRPDFWNRSLDVIDRRVEQFLALAR